MVRKGARSLDGLVVGESADKRPEAATRKNRTVGHRASRDWRGGVLADASRLSPTQRRAAGTPTEREIDFGPLSDFIGFRLRQAQDAAFRAFARRAGDAYLKPGRFAAMLIVDRNPGLTQKDLAQAIARDKSSVTQLIQELQREGLLQRRASETDRRSRVLRLTPKGAAAVQVLLKRATEHERHLDAIADGRRSELMSVLREIADEFV